MHRLKAHIRVLALCACALLASCARPTEANFRKAATPRVDEYSRLLIRQMLARDTSSIRRKFSPAMLQIPHASDSLAALARYFPDGAERVKLVGVNQQWTSYVTTRLLTYEVRSKGGQYAAVQVQTLEDELHNLYVNGFYVQPLEGPIPQPAPLIPMPGVPWWPFVLLLLGGGIFAMTQLFRKRPASDPRTVPLFPDTPRNAAQRAAAGRHARTYPQPPHTPDATPYIAPAILINVAPTERVEPAAPVDCAPVADSASIHRPSIHCEPESGYTVPPPRTGQVPAPRGPPWIPWGPPWTPFRIPATAPGQMPAMIPARSRVMIPAPMCGSTDAAGIGPEGSRS